ncbi:MAG: hypothetical protein H0W88_08695 [Parachlamydiaceae bacterium]|nr:hypothetical protein [Parachlamydiaceae bacterium]
MFEKRTDIIQHNAEVLLHHPDAILSADITGKIYRISRTNYLGRIINWILDPKGTNVQTAVRKMIVVMKEKFKNTYKTHDDIEKFTVQTPSIPKYRNPLEADLSTTHQIKGTILTLFNHDVPTHIKPYQGILKESLNVGIDFDIYGNETKYETTTIKINMYYPEMASYIANLPLFNKNPDLVAEVMDLRNYAINKLQMPITPVAGTFLFNRG